jgi:AcrR family transcriptional regulator
MTGVPRESMHSEPTNRLSRRSVRRGRVKREIALAALELFRERGYESVTVNEIAESVGLSRRSFFRYFGAKDDLVFEWMTEQGEFLLSVIQGRPASETAWQTMRATLLELAELHDAHADLALYRTRLIFDTPSLSGRFHEEHARWEGRFVEALMRGHKYGTEKAYELRVQVAICITAFVVAIRNWLDAPSVGSLRPWVIAAFAAVSRAGGAERQRADVPIEGD